MKKLMVLFVMCAGLLQAQVTIGINGSSAEFNQYDSAGGFELTYRHQLSETSPLSVFGGYTQRGYGVSLFGEISEVNYAGPILGLNYSIARPGNYDFYTGLHYKSLSHSSTSGVWLEDEPREVDSTSGIGFQFGYLYKHKRMYSGLEFTSSKDWSALTLNLGFDINLNEAKR